MRRILFSWLLVLLAGLPAQGQVQGTPAVMKSSELYSNVAVRGIEFSPS